MASLYAGGSVAAGLAAVWVGLKLVDIIPR